MFEIVKCLREKSIPSASCSADQTKVEEVVGFQCIMFQYIVFSYLTIGVDFFRY